MDTGLDLSTTSKKRSHVHVSPASSDAESSPVKDGGGYDSSQNNTPRKNKRKSSEPRRRSDFSIKRLCPDAPHAGDPFHTEDGEGRYRENPPSTPETNNSTPSPPDNHDLAATAALRIPQVPRMPLSQPMQAAAAMAPVGFLPHYPLGVPLMPVPSSLMAHHHMVTRQLPVTQMISKDGLVQQPVTSGVSAGMAATSSEREINHSVAATRATTEGKGKSRRQHSQANRSHLAVPKANPVVFEPPAPVMDREMDSPSPTGRRSRKNYKNMTRERRVEANARERTRVHTISAAFEELRHAVPSYSYNQRLSKLAILRIACTYIMSLASLAGEDYSWDKNPPSFAECVDQCTKTIQTEGRAKRRH